jgi:3-oxoacyl-[acyl-carrier-protein] synthase II
LTDHRVRPSAFDTQIAGEVKDFDPRPRSLAQGNPPHGPLLAIRRLMPAGQALKDSGLDLDKENRDEIGVIIGSGIGGLHHRRPAQILLERGPGRFRRS